MKVTLPLLHYGIMVVCFFTSLVGLPKSASAGTEDFLHFRLNMKNDSNPTFEGFSEFVGGNEMKYFSHRNPVSIAHIARAEKDLNVMEWKTAAIPENWRGDRANFVWVAGIGVGQGTRNFQLTINGKERFLFSTRPDSAWTVRGAEGSELQFVSVTADGYGDLFGYMKMTVPGHWLTPGKPLDLKMIGEEAGSSVWVMVFKFPNAVSGLEPIDKDLYYTVHMRNYLISSIDVVSPRLEWVGKTVSLAGGKKIIGQAPLEKDGDIAKSVLHLSPYFRPMEGVPLFLAVDGVDGKETVALDSREYARKRLLAFLNEEISFDHKIFPPGEFPKVTWKRPGMVDNEMGEFDLNVTFYDANYHRMEKAEKMGRYGAVVEAKLPDGYPLKRYVTLFCGQDHLDTMMGGFKVHLNRFSPLGIPETTWNTRQTTIDRCLGETLSRSYLEDLGEDVSVEYAAINRWRMVGGKIDDSGDLAVILAGAADLGDKGVKHEYEADPYNLDRQWWLGFKRQESGAEKKYPALKGPVKNDKTIATVLHEGDPASVGYSPEQVEAIRQVCRDWVRDGKEPLSVLVARKGTIILHESFGDYPDGKKMTVDTPTWMASITKLITGCVMMQFVDQGLINLDDPVSKYLPELECKTATPLTIRHLFTHTSGLWGHGTWGADWNNSFENVLGEYMPYLEVGKKHEYNGIGYTVAAKVMERVSGKALPFLDQEQLLQPLEDDHTTVQGASGDTRSICMDMAKVAQMLLNRGGYGNIRFFSEETFRKMLPIKLDKLVPGSTIEWGIGVTWSTYEGVTNRTFGHGAASGAVLQIDPKNELVIVCCRNKIGLNHFENVQKFMRACTAPFNTPAVPKK